MLFRFFIIKLFRSLKRHYKLMKVHQNDQIPLSLSFSGNAKKSKMRYEKERDGVRINKGTFSLPKMLRINTVTTAKSSLKIMLACCSFNGSRILGCMTMVRGGMIRVLVGL